MRGLMGFHRSGVSTFRGRQNDRIEVRSGPHRVIFHLDQSQAWRKIRVKAIDMPICRQDTEWLLSVSGHAFVNVYFGSAKLPLAEVVGKIGFRLLNQPSGHVSGAANPGHHWKRAWHTDTRFFESIGN